MPPVELLKDYGSEEISINKEELEENKNKIVGLLKNFNVGIAEIKATIGPTVTLYEIVPEAGIRVAAIKKLQDDIALNLSALGIRIIAPMPGKGTIGIEVPRKKSYHGFYAFRDCIPEIPEYGYGSSGGFRKNDFQRNLHGRPFKNAALIDGWSNRTR